MSQALHVAEPPARYQLRPPLVLDCSVLAAAIFREETQEQAQQQLRVHQLHAPYLLQSEIASVALKKLRNGFEQEVRSGLKWLEGLSIDLHRIEEEAVVTLAARYQLSAYDATYLWLAADLKAPLATFDARLAVAARSHLGSLN